MGVRIIDTTFRDAHQSLIATRLRTEYMLPVAEDMDSIGFYSMEVWGGATFDVCIRYLREDPWVRLKELRSRIRKTKLQMLLRGQNLVGYQHYPDDVVEAFVGKAYEAGIDIFRVFDALNDVRNMEVSIKKAKKAGALVQGAISYTVSPVHTLEHYMKIVEELLALEVDVITIKDMAGIITPHSARELIHEIKSRFKVPVNLHTHSTGGMSTAAYVCAVESGVDFIDTSISPLAFGTAQPGIQSVYHALKPELRPDIDMGLVGKVSKYLSDVLEKKYSHLLNPKILLPNPKVVIHQIPGGMLSNLISQLKHQNALDRLDEVLEEVPRVRKDLGYPPLVTPLSQIVGTQAVMNVMAGRYKIITKEVVKYVKGLYGRPPAPFSKEIVDRVLKGEKPFEGRPADLLEPRLEKCREEVRKLGVEATDENVLTYCLFPDTATEFFKGAPPPPEEKPKPQRSGGQRSYRVVVDGKSFTVVVRHLEK